MSKNVASYQNLSEHNRLKEVHGWCDTIHLMEFKGRRINDRLATCTSKERVEVRGMNLAETWAIASAESVTRTPSSRVSDESGFDEILFICWRRADGIVSRCLYKKSSSYAGTMQHTVTVE
ncbi:hypothetical protein QAD02_021933 [Eretmocerus hayati]|uniref:Uncharacterized protein n=1 Tax=Eretmocerus hayati TaxID=131215 RepID=A0ACC2PRC2_9HYME|nr:hypothetical protein QAD02_021933 [Eretmocerus hayati]